ncbi:MAG: hypothetical protein DME21_05380 [Verrucomicrobia bacterium]|nr:MAG: hypothetical protein DME21_05380 [Verrucomicrobiota bacterium]
MYGWVPLGKVGASGNGAVTRTSRKQPKKPPLYPWPGAAVFLYAAITWLIEYANFDRLTIYEAGRVGAVYTGSLAVAVIGVSLVAGFAFLAYAIYLWIFFRKS